MSAVNDSRNLGRFFRREPSLTQCRIYRWLWIGFYCALFALRDSLPERFSRDAETLNEMIVSGDFEEGSYGAMAAIYSLVPGPVLPFLPALACIPSLWIVLGFVRSYAVMLLLPIILMPYLIMNFMNPTKETLVALIIIAVYKICRSPTMTTFRAAMLILGMYGVYALYIRSYYILIAAFFAAILIVKYAPRFVTVIGAVAVLAVMAVLPAEVYQAIQGPRDDASHLMSRLSQEVRTLFFNPMPPDNMLNFFINMAWGIFVMYVPFVIAQSFNEVLMLVNVLFYTGMVLALIRHKQGAGQLPAYLFMGHILTQAQFEPDLGSYVRHFSCVLVMLSPGIYYMFRNRPADEIPPPEEEGRPAPEEAPQAEEAVRPPPQPYGQR